MKRLHIALLLLAGAAGGALLMNVVRNGNEVPTATVAQAPAPAAQAEPEPPAPVVEPEAPAAPEPAKPSPAPRERQLSRRPPAPRGNPEPIAAPESPAAPAAPSPEPVRQTAPEPAAPPARLEPQMAPPAPLPPPRKVTLDAGMLIPVRLVDGLSSERNSPGDTFMATIDRPIVVDGFVVAERGARVEGRVAEVDRGGRVKGVATMAVEITRLHTADGQAVALETDSFQRAAEQTRKQDAAKVGIGAAVGAAIGAIAGGGKGAAIGAGVGGGAGAGSVALSRGQAATLPSETRISFRLRNPVIITERR